jgi:alcohol dehydrogenase
MAGIAMNPTRLGLAHALAMPLGSWDLRVPHGIAIAVTLPRVMKFNCVAAPEPYALVARALGESVDQLSPADSAQRAVTAVENLASAIQIPKGLAEHGVRPSHIPRVIDEAMKSGNVAVNPRPTSKEQLTAVLEQSL